MRALAWVDGASIAAWIVGNSAVGTLTTLAPVRRPTWTVRPVMVDRLGVMSSRVTVNCSAPSAPEGNPDGWHGGRDAGTGPITGSNGQWIDVAVRIHELHAAR